MIPFLKPYFPEDTRTEILAKIDNVLETGVLIDGPYTKQFEREFADLIGVRHAVALNSCTTALQICLQHKIPAGSEVLVPSGSFVTDINVVKWADSAPVLVDMNPDSLSFDLDDLQRKLSKKTKAIIWVHLTGVVSFEYQQIVEFAKKNSLLLIEDCAHAHGAMIDGKPAGALGDAGCFSFYPTKVMTSGSGGMLTTDNDDLANYARTVRYHGKNPETGTVTEVGNNWYLDEIRACVALGQMKDLPENLKRRREIAEHYDSLLRNTKGLHFLTIPDSCLPTYYHYVVLLGPTYDFAELRQALKEKHGIPTKNIYRPTHEEPIFTELNDGSLKSTEATLHRSLCLPVFPDMKDDQVEQVAKAVIEEMGLMK